MQNQPLISFIIPVFNVPDEMLTTCLQSIFSLQLNASEREVIVVDDGSEWDITRSWCNAWCNEIVYKRQRNQRQGKARNVALDMARGQYIQFVDADDYLIPHIYNKVISFVRKHNGIDLLSFGFTSNQKALAWAKEPTERMTGPYYMQHYNLRTGPCFYIYNRATLGHIRFPLGIVFEDVEFTTHIYLQAQKVYAAMAQAYFYRMRKGSTTSRQTRETYLNKYLPISEEILYRLQQVEVTGEQVAALQRRVAQLTMDHIYNVMRFTHNLSFLNNTLKCFRQHKLYPLPNEHYTRKYTLFRLLIQCRLTRAVLTLILK